MILKSTTALAIPLPLESGFFVPLFIIDAVVDKIKVGDISEYRYDPERSEVSKKWSTNNKVEVEMIRLKKMACVGVAKRTHAFNSAI